MDESNSEMTERNPPHGRATVRDVTLRDGLQGVETVLATTDKVRLYELLIEGGVQEAQVTSFVSPRRVPQLADAEELWRRLEGMPGRRDALIANYRGFERAVATGVDRLEMVLAVSSSYHRRNSNRSQEETLQEISRVAQDAVHSGVHLGVVLSNAWNCSYEGDTPWERLEEWLLRIAELEPDEVSLADTTGAARPEEVEERVKRARALLPQVFLRVHLHALPSRGDDAEKSKAAVAGGADGLDAGLLGLGGSPFAGEVGGNVDLLELARSGVWGGRPEPLEEAEALLAALLGREVGRR